MSIPRFKPDGDIALSYGVMLKVKPRTKTDDHLVQRAPWSGGLPDTANAKIIARLPAGRLELIDYHTSQYFYRVAAIALGKSQSNWSDWSCRASAPFEVETPAKYWIDERGRRTDSLYSSDGRLVSDALQDVTAAIDSASIGESGTAPTIIVRYSPVFDAQARHWRVYLRTGAGNWPTTDGSQTGPISETYFQAEYRVGYDPFYQDTGHSAADVLNIIVVPLNLNGDAGDRDEQTYTVAGTATPQLTAAYAEVSDVGTSCTAGSRREYTVTWATTGASDPNQDLRVWIRINSGAWELVISEASPVGTTSGVYEMMYYASASGDDIHVDFKVELVTTAGPTVVDERTWSEQTFQGVECIAPI